MAGARSVDRHRETSALLGMTLFLASWAMLFAALFFSYGLIRLRSSAWPPPDLPRLPLAAPALATVALALASLLLERTRRAAQRGAVVKAWPLATAWLASAAFLGIQVLVWQQLWNQGLRLDAGPYGSAFFGLTGFHALHVLVGLGGLLVLIAGAASGRGVRPIPLKLWTLYLHMVGVLWGLVFVALYLL